MFLQNHLPGFLNQLGGRKTPRNREIYTCRLESFLELHGHRVPGAVTSEHITAWLAMLEERGYSAATMVGYRQALKSFFRYLVDEDILDKSPARKLVIGTTSSGRLRLPAPKDLQTAGALARTWMLTSNDPRQIRDGCIFRLSLACGPRSKELRRLRHSDVRRALARGPNEHGVYVVASNGKTGLTLMRFDEDCAAGLRRWLAVRPNDARIDACFTPMRRSRTKRDRRLAWRIMSRSSLDSAFVALCRAAGVAPIRPHLIRHHVGTEIARRSGARMSALVLNHRDWNKGAATANTFYIHQNEADVAAALGITPPAPQDSATLQALDQLFRNGR